MEEAPRNILRKKLQDLVDGWRQTRLPGRSTLMETGNSLSRWKTDQHLPGLWTPSPVMVTATLDDGFGHGIHLIGLYASLCGVTLYPLGSLAPPSRIIDACQQYHPDILGLTVLRDDQEEALVQIRKGVSPGTLLMAGGPAVMYDPDLASRVGIDRVCQDLRYFLEFLLGYEKIEKQSAAMDTPKPDRKDSPCAG